MNIQSGRFKGKRTTKTTKEPIGEKFLAITKLIILLVAVGMVFNVYIYLNQKIAETESNIRRYELKIKNAQFDIKSLEIKKEQLTTLKYINAKIKQYNLKLRQAQYGQIENLVLYQPVGESYEMASSQNFNNSVKTAIRR